MGNEVWVNKLIRKSNVFRVQEFQGDVIFNINSLILRCYLNSQIVFFIKFYDGKKEIHKYSQTDTHYYMETS